MSGPTVALSRFDSFNCQAVTTLRFFFSFTVGGSRLGAPIWTTFICGSFPILPKNKCNIQKGWKMCERQFKASSITVSWQMLPSKESFLSLEKPMSIKVLSIQCRCSSYSCFHFIAVISHFFRDLWRPRPIHSIFIFTSLFSFCHFTFCQKSLDLYA